MVLYSVVQHVDIQGQGDHKVLQSLWRSCFFRVLSCGVIPEPLGKLLNNPIRVYWKLDLAARVTLVQILALLGERGVRHGLIQALVSDTVTHISGSKSTNLFIRGCCSVLEGEGEFNVGCKGARNLGVFVIIMSL